MFTNWSRRPVATRRGNHRLQRPWRRFDDREPFPWTLLVMDDKEAVILYRLARAGQVAFIRIDDVLCRRRFGRLPEGCIDLLHYLGRFLGTVTIRFQHDQLGTML